MLLVMLVTLRQLVFLGTDRHPLVTYVPPGSAVAAPAVS
jgi:hypothetical protein